MNPLFPRLGRLFSVLGVVAFLSVAVGGQGRLQTSPKRTPWGHADLQGLWTNTTTTPLERPAALGDKATQTVAERAELDRRAARNADAPPPPGNPGAYNTFWFERGRQSNQTSLIVDHLTVGCLR